MTHEYLLDPHRRYEIEIDDITVFDPDQAQAMRKAVKRANLVADCEALQDRALLRGIDTHGAAYWLANRAYWLCERALITLGARAPFTRNMVEIEIKTATQEIERGGQP